MIVVVICHLTIIQVNGDFIRETRPLSSSSFDEIVINGIFDVFLSSNSSSKVEIETTSDLEKKVIVEIVDNHILSIRLDQVTHINKHINVYIEFSSPLHRYTFKGTGNTVTNEKGISNEDNQVLIVDQRGVGDLNLRLNIFKFEFYLSGTGNSVFSGQVRQQILINAKGVGDINALNLSTKIADVFVKGVNKIQVAATDDLRIDVKGISTVYYRLPNGKTPSKAIATGLGKIVPLS